MKYLIVGLGNVGDQYAHTRHNIGFDVVAAFLQKHKGQLAVGRLAYHAEIKWKGNVFVCICPTTYMNLSGKAVKYWMEKENIERSNLLVIVDDLATPWDKIRIKPGGSDAGHNGLKSIQDYIGSTDYPKLRFGIGNDFAKEKQADFVLSKWRKEEEPMVEKKIAAAATAIEVFASQGIAIVMNQYNNLSFA
ncbi:MAG: aminoacyl-tRNA hydrolase [Bacteroidetes bacterium]|nr:aminoacyl-tRNA hydrolase [Bacteroidota bacterium]